MSEPTRHTTPDGKFTLVFDPAEHLIGFDEYSWQLDHDNMVKYFKVSTEAQLLEALAANRLALIISRFEESGDEIQDVWLSHDPAGEKDCADEGEILECRYWNGTPA
jgi:hypothetical protein